MGGFSFCEFEAANDRKAANHAAHQTRIQNNQSGTISTPWFPLTKTDPFVFVELAQLELDIVRTKFTLMSPEVAHSQQVENQME